MLKFPVCCEFVGVNPCALVAIFTMDLGRRHFKLVPGSNLADVLLYCQLRPRAEKEYILKSSVGCEFSGVRPCPLVSSFRMDKGRRHFKLVPVANFVHVLVQSQLGYKREKENVSKSSGGCEFGCVTACPLVSAFTM